MNRCDVRKGEALSVLGRLDSGTVGAVVSDPPFFTSVGRAQGWDVDRGFGQDPWEAEVGTAEGAVRWAAAFAAEFHRVVRPGGAVVLMAGSTQVAAAWMLAAERAGLIWMSEMAVLWNAGKVRARNFGSLYTKILWFARPGARHVWNSEKRSIYSNVLVAERVGGSIADRHHPAQKPVELTTFLISLLTRPSDLVVDPFCGSGSTGVSAAIAGRGFLGIDRDQEYVRVARKRVRNFELEDENPIYLWINGVMEEI